MLVLLKGAWAILSCKCSGNDSNGGASVSPGLPPLHLQTATSLEKQIRLLEVQGIYTPLPQFMQSVLHVRNILLPFHLVCKTLLPCGVGRLQDLVGHHKRHIVALPQHKWTNTPFGLVNFFLIQHQHLLLYYICISWSSRGAKTATRLQWAKNDFMPSLYCNVQHIRLNTSHRHHQGQLNLGLLSFKLKH